MDADTKERVAKRLLILANELRQAQIQLGKDAAATESKAEYDSLRDRAEHLEIDEAVIRTLAIRLRSDATYQRRTGLANPVTYALEDAERQLRGATPGAQP